MQKSESKTAQELMKGLAAQLGEYQKIAKAVEAYVPTIPLVESEALARAMKVAKGMHDQLLPVIKALGFAEKVLPILGQDYNIWKTAFSNQPPPIRIPCIAETARSARQMASLVRTPPTPIAVKPSGPTWHEVEEKWSQRLEFVEDKPLRTLLAINMAEVEFALKGELWHAVAVLSGATCEGLLRHLWVRCKKPKIAKRRGQPDFDNLVKWASGEFKSLGTPLKFVDGCRDIRNCVHPDRAIEKGYIPTDNIAELCKNGVEHLIRVLKENWDDLV